MDVHILVVDDDPRVGRILCQYINGSKIISADAQFRTTAEEAFAYASEEGRTIDICLIDQKLERGTDGITLVNAMKAIQPDTDFIMITGQAGHETISEAASSGVYGYLLKKIKREVLEWTLKSLIERRHARLERSWFEIILDISNDSFSAESIEDLAKILVDGGTQLRFKRARFWQCIEQKTLRCIAHDGHENDGDLLHKEIDARQSEPAKEVMMRKEPTFFPPKEQRQESPVKGLFTHKVGEWAALPIWGEEKCEAILALDFGDKKILLSREQKRLLRFLNRQADASLAHIRQKEQSKELHNINLSNKEAEITRKVQEAALNVHHLTEEDPYRRVIQPLIEGVAKLLDMPNACRVGLLLRRRQIDKFGNHEDVQVDYIVKDGKLIQYIHTILDEGISGEVFREGKWKYVKDAQTYPSYYQGELKKDIKTLSELDVPIFDFDYGHQVIGVWNIEATVPDPFSDHHIHTLERFAKVTSSVLQSFKRINRLKKMLITMENVTSDAPFEETMVALGDTIYEALPSVDTLTIWHKHPKENAYEARFGYARGLMHSDEFS